VSRPAAVVSWSADARGLRRASYRCYVRLFDSYGIGFDRARFQSTYSPNWQRTYEAVGLAPELWNEADQRWLEHYDQERTRLVPGAREALARLEAAGVAQGVVTSGDRSRVSRELADLGVEDCFETVVPAVTRRGASLPETTALAWRIA
jgi:phosphoglycolate phosphatase-like HAD superfamily hydrolase